MLLKAELDFYDVLGNILFVDYLKQNYKYVDGKKTDMVDSFSVKCFSLNQKDTFVLKIMNLDLIETVMSLDTFTKIDIENGSITNFKGKHYFKCQSFRVLDNA